MKCLLDPFDCIEGDLPCVPDLYDFPSYKFYVRSRGVLATSSSTGVGFLCSTPFNPTNDTSSFAYTTSAFVGGGITPAASGVTAAAYGNSAITTAICPSFRPVAHAIRVRYLGTELNMGGNIIPVRADSEADTVTSLTSTSAYSRSNVRTYPVDRKWRGVAWIPGYPNAYSFGSSVLNIVNAGVPRLGILINAASATTSVNFEFDVVTFFECLPDGSTSTLGMSRSHSDTPGLSLVRDFLGGLTASDIGKSAVQAGLHYLKSSAVNYLSGGASLILDAFLI